MLKAEDMVFQRNEQGNLIAQDVELETLSGDEKPVVKVKPLTRGKLQEIHAKATSLTIEDRLSADIDVIKSGLVEPVLTEEQILDLKPQYAGAISTAILAVSLDVSQKDVNNQILEALSDQEAELKKN